MRKNKKRLRAEHEYLKTEEGENERDSETNRRKYRNKLWKVIVNCF